MPKFGFYVQDLLPSQWKPGQRAIGEDLGCELGLRRTAAGDSEVYVKVFFYCGSQAQACA